MDSRLSIHVLVNFHFNNAELLPTTNLCFLFMGLPGWAPGTCTAWVQMGSRVSSFQTSIFSRATYLCGRVQKCKGLSQTMQTLVKLLLPSHAFTFHRPKPNTNTWPNPTSRGWECMLLMEEEGLTDL